MPGNLTPPALSLDANGRRDERMRAAPIHCGKCGRVKQQAPALLSGGSTRISLRQRSSFPRRHRSTGSTTLFRMIVRCSDTSKGLLNLLSTACTRRFHASGTSNDAGKDCRHQKSHARDDVQHMPVSFNAIRTGDPQAKCQELLAPYRRLAGCLTSDLPRRTR